MIIALYKATFTITITITIYTCYLVATTASTDLVVVVDAGAEVSAVAVVQRWPEQATSLGQHVDSVGRAAWVDVVVHLFAFLPEHRRAVLERPGPARNRVLSDHTVDHGSGPSSGRVGSGRVRDVTQPFGPPLLS